MYCHPWSKTYSCSFKFWWFVQKSCQSGQMWSRTAYSNIYQSLYLSFQAPRNKIWAIVDIHYQLPRISLDIAANCCKPGSGEHFCILLKTRTICFGHQAPQSCIALVSHEMSRSLQLKYMVGRWWFQAILGRCSEKMNVNMWWITGI